jgi:hypothetical protein
VPNLTGATSTSILGLIFNATAWTSIAQNSGSPATNLYVSLHNADPGASGNQTSNETVYTNYARIAVARTSAGWTVGGSSPTINVTNAVAVTFAQCGATGDTLTHWGLGLSLSGAGTLLGSGPIGAGPVTEFTCTAASPGVVTIPGNSLALNSRLSLYASAGVPFPTLSSGSEGTVYYVGTLPGGAGQITLSTTAGNSTPVNCSVAGGGYSVVQSPLVVSNGVTPAFAAGTLILYQF